MKMQYRFLKIVSLALLLLPVALHAQSVEVEVKDTSSGRPVENVVVIAEPLNHNSPRRHSQTLLVDQIDKEFVNTVTVLQQGDKINFPNMDHIRHHVYSFSAPKEFELPLYEGTPAEPITFEKPGIVKLGCNIHDWMFAYLYIAEKGYTAVSNEDGKASLTNLPDGSYEIRIWHYLMKQKERSTVRKIDIKNGIANTNLTWDIRLKPDFRPRRAPTMMQLGY